MENGKWKILSGECKEAKKGCELKICSKHLKKLAFHKFRRYSAIVF